MCIYKYYIMEDSSLFLDNVLERIKILEQTNDTNMILTLLLREIYHYNNKTWTIPLHNVILNLIKYSIKCQRTINIDMDMYYNLLVPLEDTTSFKELINTIWDNLEKNDSDDKMCLIQKSIYKKEVFLYFLDTILNKSSIRYQYLFIIIISIYDDLLQNNDVSFFNEVLLKFINIIIPSDIKNKHKNIISRII